MMVTFLKDLNVEYIVNKAMKKKISIPFPYMVNELTKKYKCARQMVYQAVSFKRNSDLAREIRIDALEMGCGYYGMELPKVDTEHDEVRGLMIQRFGEHAELRFKKGTGETKIVFGGKVRRVEMVYTEDDLLRLQEEVQRMALAY